MPLKNLRSVIAFVAVTSCSSAILFASGAEIQLFQTLGWTTVQAIGAVNPDVIAALQSRMGDDPRISDRGGPFNAGDVVTGEPARRFLVAGRSASRWFVAYERGGRGHHMVLVVLKSGSKGFEPVLLTRGTVRIGDRPAWIVGVADLRAALKSGTMRQDDVHEAYY